MSDHDVQDPGRGAAPPPGSEHHHTAPPPGAHAMNLLRWGLFAGLLVLAVVSVGSFLMSRRSGSGSATARHEARYYCPMHPSYTSDRPGECPICGMTLEPIPAGGIGGTAVGGGDVPGLTSVHITPDRLQMIGVRTARVDKRAVGGEMTLAGFVAPEESRLRRVQLRLPGWVREVFVDATGQSVSAGQPLLTITSPQLYQAEQEYLIELSARSPAGDADHESGGLHAALGRLTLFGVPHDEIRRLGSEKLAQSYLTAVAPVAGVVIERNVTQGQYVPADAALCTIADLSRVWVLADLYEMDFGRVRAGDHATFTADAATGVTREGRIDLIYPTVSSETRTLRVRLTFDNRDGQLRPGMYGRVRVAGRGGQTLVVPNEAIINSGQHQYVFLARTGGHFEPRMVWTGAHDGERVQVLKGVAEGDTVVASASFLIDSESRLKAAIAGMGSQPTTTHQH